MSASLSRTSLTTFRRSSSCWPILSNSLPHRYLSTSPLNNNSTSAVPPPQNPNPPSYLQSLVARFTSKYVPGIHAESYLALANVPALYQACRDAAEPGYTGYKGKGKDAKVVRAKRGKDAEFWYGALSLPPTYQSMHSITLLHTYLLFIRFKALNPPHGKEFFEKMTSHFWLEMERELREEERWIVRGKGRIVSSTLKSLNSSYHGALLALDEGLLTSDASLASALWRNLFGRGWGEVGGTEGRGLLGLPGFAGGKGGAGGKDDQEAMAMPSATAREDSTTGDSSSSRHLFQPPHPIPPLQSKIHFPENLERIVIWMRKELIRLDGIRDSEIVRSAKDDEAREKVVNWGRV